ncbi:MAG TPA: 1-acyl-sn-glycerol-3-phosphate acyltransferase [Peptococcaceae bacterium]|nr:1-acyl-sn-glycerol-3-phosphate acyltransferase [Peptococcaceae bacterium]
MKFYSFAKKILTLFLKAKGFTVKGLENLPAEGPLIVACNHVSLWDPIIVGCALPRQIFFMAKEELFKIPILGTIITWLGAFPVKRGQGDISAIRKSLGVLKAGNVLGIFPEGTRSASGAIQEAMAGIVLIMEKSKAPILPVKIYGSKGLLRQKRGNIGIVIGKPIYAQNLTVPPDVENPRSWLANEIMSTVGKM